LSASKGKKGRLQKDYYGYLGLGNSRWQATSKDIERAYKNIALRFHPDKCAGTGASEREREAVEERFKLIGEAYEVLTDTRKRREFDSVDGGDDNLPTSCEESKFYETFAPAVERMARWSARKPVPMLGDENTPYNEVEKFYRFWHQFKSWREFPQDDEYDLEDAEGREHKRWMQKENEKMRKKAKQEESQRIRTFVQTMESLDPRVLEKKEADRKRREEKKEARKSTASKGDEQAPQHKQQQQQQSREKGAAASSTTARATPAPSAAASDASSRTEDEQQSDEAQDKKDKEKEKKQMRKERQKIRKEAQRASDHLGDQKAVEALCSHCSMKYLKRFVHSAHIWYAVDPI
jgi:DnaJ family protein C protein 2